jgi:CRP/FNR family transcriptional regulator
MIETLRANYGKLFSEALIQEINEVGTLVEIEAGVTFMEIGSYVKGMPLILSGAIKVLREDEKGDELLLYYLEKGETCSMTLSCCMGITKSEVRAIAETNTVLIMIPIRKMEEWTSKYHSWRNFVFNSYHFRLNEMLNTLDSIAFSNMDERLLEYLTKKSQINSSSRLEITHQQIAFDLHSSRVVISRLLKKLENKGCIELNRNYIQIINI